MLKFNFREEPYFQSHFFHMKVFPYGQPKNHKKNHENSGKKEIHVNSTSAKKIVFMISQTNSGISEMQLRGMLQYSFRAQTAFHDAQCATFVEA